MKFLESDELRARTRQLAAIAELGLRAMEDMDLSTLMDEAVALVAENLAVEYVKLFELQPDGESLLLRAGVGWEEGLIGQAIVGGDQFDSPSGHTLASEEPVIVEDLPSETRFGEPPLLHDHGVRSGVTVIIHGREQPFGVLGADTSRRRKFTKDDVSFLQAVANVLATAIEHLHEAPQHTTGTNTAGRRFAFLARASELLSSSLDYSSALTYVAHLVVPELADCCTVEMLEEGTVHRSAMAHVDPAKEDLVRELRSRYPLDPGSSSTASEVLRTGRSRTVPEITDAMLAVTAHETEDLKMLRELSPTSYLCVPLLARGRILGVINMISAESGRRYGPEDVTLAESLANCAALAIESARLHLPELEIARGLIQLARKSYKTASSSDRSEVPTLTPRQLEVLELLSEGKSAKDIRQELHISEATVRNHIRALLQALGARSQLEAIAQAREMGILPG